jgi:hypothetical protein
MKTISLKNQEGNSLSVMYEIVQNNDIFGISITEGKRNRTENFTKNREKAEEILQFCIHNEVMIESLGDCIDNFYNHA